jgi:regulator of sigma E protease
LITAVDGEPVQIWSDLRWRLLQSAVDKHAAVLDFERADAQAPQKPASGRATLAASALAHVDLEADFLPALGLDLARPPAVMGKIMADSPAEQAGLRAGDLVQSVDGKPVQDGMAFIELVRAAPERELALSVLRAGAPLEIKVLPQAVEKQGHRFGRIGAEVPMAPEMVNASAPLPKAIARGAEKTWDTSVMTLRMLGRMLIGEVSLKNITGPITIADYAGQTARIGMVSYLSFIAFISISLGVMNLLPIPVLDGGLLLYYSLEVLTGRPVPERFGELAQRAGIGILMTLMIVAVFNDIVRLIS